MGAKSVSFLQTPWGAFPSKTRGGSRDPSRARKFVVRRREGTRFCQSQPPALVLLETMMPGLDSFSAALDIRRASPASKIAMLTRNRTPDHLLRVRQHRLNGQKGPPGEAR